MDLDNGSYPVAVAMCLLADEALDELACAAAVEAHAAGTTTDEPRWLATERGVLGPISEKHGMGNTTDANN